MATLENQRITWQVAHEALSRLARERAAADAEEGRWLLAAARAAAHVHLGYSSFGEYVERMFGYKPRSTQEKLRVAEALEGLPAFARALSSGEINWSAARELTRVAVRETEQEWLEFTRGKTLRQLEQVLTGRRPGDAPASPPDLSATRHVLRFEVAAETFALFRDAMNELRRRAGAALDDDSALEPISVGLVAHGPSLAPFGHLDARRARDSSAIPARAVRRSAPKFASVWAMVSGGLPRWALTRDGALCARRAAR